MLFQAYHDMDYEDMEHGQQLDRFVFMFAPNCRYKESDGDLILIDKIQEEEYHEDEDLPF